MAIPSSKSYNQVLTEQHNAILIFLSESPIKDIKMALPIVDYLKTLREMRPNDEGLLFIDSL